MTRGSSATSPDVDLTCCKTLTLCAAGVLVDAPCCLTCCCFCGGCCGQYDACTVVATRGMSLFGEDEPETEPGAERAQTTCMVQAYACLVATLCCGCFLGCCGLATPCVRAVVERTLHNTEAGAQRSRAAAARRKDSITKAREGRDSHRVDPENCSPVPVQMIAVRPIT